MMLRAERRPARGVAFTIDGKPIVLGVAFPSLRVAIRDVRAAMTEQRSLTARARLAAALVALEAANDDGCVPVPLEGLDG